MAKELGHMAHTETPWSVDALGYLRGPNNENILEEKLNAAFIVRAVNNHAGLLEILKAITTGGWIDSKELEQLAREAIAKVEAK
jgi:hypothetical protein